MEKIKIGKIVATFSLDGQVIITHSLGKKASFKKVKALFVEQVKNSFVPYFIVSDKIKNEEETVIKFDSIYSKDEARPLIGKNAWLLQEDFELLVSKQSAIGLLGFRLLDNGKKIGDVIEVIEQSHQILLKILINNKEVYIPMHNDNVIGINYKIKEINLELPEGLLEIYL